MMQIDSAPEVVQWLKARPAGATIAWGDDGLSADHRYASRAADPVVAGCPVLWPWHVVGPDEPEPQNPGSTTLVLEYDLDVYELWPAGPCAGPLGAWAAERDRPLDVVSKREFVELRELPGTFLVLSGGWRPRTISSVLRDWARTRANRPDIDFRWDPQEKSAVFAAFIRFTGHSESRAAAGRKWAILYAAPQSQLARVLADTDDSQGHAVRRSLRIAQAHRWARRMRIDPALAWLTPAEAGVLADLGPADDVYAWAVQHRVPTAPGDGIGPLLSAAAVLALAES
jgi:hypothetical protein